MYRVTPISDMIKERSAVDLQGLKLFRAVADAGSLSKAAVHLHYAQSNLSTKMLQLEKELHAKLLYRTSHGVTLTPKGKVLYGYAGDLLSLADEALRAMSDDGCDTGSISIGSMESTAAAFLPRFLADFHQAHPQISVRVDTGTTRASIDKLLDHRVDGAFVAGPLHHPDLESIFIRTEHLVLISDPADSRADIREIISKRPMLVFPVGCSYRKSFERLFEETHLLPKQVFEFNTLNAILSSLNAGLGAALLPSSVIDQIPYDFSVHEVPREIADVQTIFIYHKNSYLSGAMRSFIDALKTVNEAGK